MYRTADIGDKVTIRSWESMENEWGLDELGGICIPLSFTRKMRYLCGSEAVVEYKRLSDILGFAGVITTYLRKCWSANIKCIKERAYGNLQNR